jgi:hypothetical protein
MPAELEVRQAPEGQMKGVFSWLVHIFLNSSRPRVDITILMSFDYVMKKDGMGRLSESSIAVIAAGMNSN